MSDHSHDSPRRYFVDGSGRRDESGQLGSKRRGRWLELYAKHEQAWCQWMADTRANRRGNLPVVN
jgi:hypothetical protein